MTDAITIIQEALERAGTRSGYRVPAYSYGHYVKDAIAGLAALAALADLAALVDAAERINLSEEDAERASVQEHLDATAAFRAALARVKGEQNG
jgi:hypothetical protein